MLTVSSPLSRLPMPVIQVMQMMIATVRPVETAKSGGLASSTTMVESMPPWAGSAVAAECAGEEGEEGMAKSVDVGV
jgi:hypothetical protein